MSPLPHGVMREAVRLIGDQWFVVRSEDVFEEVRGDDAGAQGGTRTRMAKAEGF